MGKHVFALVDTSRQYKLAITCATIMSFGRSVWKSLYDTDTTSAEDKRRIEQFGLGEMWGKNFVTMDSSSNRFTARPAGVTKSSLEKA